MSINAFRAYFQLADGIEAGDPKDQATNSPNATSPVRVFVLNFGDEQSGEASGIVDAEANSCVPSVASDQRSSASFKEWHSLDGRRLSGKPSRAGVYINNGVKVIIK